jgi:hypothetical protein
LKRTSESEKWLTDIIKNPKRSFGILIFQNNI